jgi:hypothetical protein
MTKGRCIYYIDDSLNMEQDFDKCKDNTNIMVQKLDDLGYRINKKKGFSTLVKTLGAEAKPKQRT